MKRVATDPATRARALQIAAERGAAQASRETGVPAGTIRAWRARSEDPAQRSAQDSRAQGDRQKQGADRMWKVAEASTRKALEAIERGDTLAAQRLMVTAGISADKTGQLEEASARTAERQVRLAGNQGQLMALIDRMFFEAVGIPWSMPVRRLLASLYRQAEEIDRDGAVAVSPDLAEAAAQDVREHFARLLRAEFERDRMERLALPAPSQPVDDVVPAEPIGAEAEVVDAEPVGDELPSGWLRMNHGDPVLARAAYESYKAGREAVEAQRAEKGREWRADPGGGMGASVSELFRSPTGGPGGGV